MVVKIRVLGLDIGTKRIGVALSDETCTIAGSLKYIERDSENVKCIKEIVKICNDMDVGKIVIGLPFKLDGSLGPMAEEIRNFSQYIKKAVSIPVIEWDERLSTKEAENIMIQADVSRKKRKMSIDKLAAQIILQSFLDSNI